MKYNGFKNNSRRDLQMELPVGELAKARQQVSIAFFKKFINNKKLINPAQNKKIKILNF